MRHLRCPLLLPPGNGARKVSGAQNLKNGKGKQVDFGQVEIVDVTGGDDSDLTDLTELDEQTQESPSPRRLRSKGEKSQRKSGIDSSRKASFVQKLKARASESAHQDEDEDLPDASDEDEDQPNPHPIQDWILTGAARGRERQSNPDCDPGRLRHIRRRAMGMMKRRREENGSGRW
jgi:hypothetical protein